MLNEETKQAKLSALDEAKKIMMALMAKDLKGGDDSSPIEQQDSSDEEAPSSGHEIEMKVEGDTDPEMLQKLEELYSKLS